MISEPTQKMDMLLIRLSAPVRLRPQASHHIQAYHNWAACGNALHAELFSSFRESYGHGSY